jgi:hypothetical protein
METEYFDEDGYPTEETLYRISSWNYQQGWSELLAFVHNIWYYANDGYWTVEKDVVVREYPNYKRVADVYNISTVGWSGNETIIRALQDNWMFWNFCWEQSRRGGHYTFHVKNDELSVNNTVSENTQKMLDKLKEGKT